MNFQRATKSNEVRMFLEFEDYRKGVNIPKIDHLKVLEKLGY